MINLPKLDLVLDRSIKAFLPGLLRIERLAKEMSAVTRVMVTLEEAQNNEAWLQIYGFFFAWLKWMNENVPSLKPML